MSISEIKEYLSRGEDSEELGSKINDLVFQITEHTATTIAPEAANELLNTISEWILQHSSSKRLENLLKLIFVIYQNQGLSEEFNFLGMDEAEVKIAACPNLVSCILSLLNSVLKSNQAEKYMRILTLLLRISAMIVQQKTVPNFFRRKGSLKMLIALYRNLVKASARSEGSIKILTLICEVMANMAVKNEKAREYLTRKAVIQASCALITNPNYTSDNKLMSKALYLLGSTAGSSDQQLLIWVSGGISQALQCVQNPKLSPSASFLLWRACIDNEEIQQEIFSSNFHLQALEAIRNGGDIEKITYLIGIIRRIVVNAKFRDQLAGLVAEPLLLELKQLTRGEFSLPLKEISAALGTISTDPAIAQIIVQAAGIEIITEVALRNLTKSKLVKTCIGALVNLSLQEGMVDRIGNNLRFYELIRAIIASYPSSSYMMEYTLRLILNALQSNNCLYHLSEVSFVTDLRNLFERWQNEEDLLLYVLYIFRSLVSHKKGIEAFSEAIPEGFIDQLLGVFQHYISNVKVLTEIILLISALSQQEGIFLDTLKRSDMLSTRIKECLEIHSKDQNKTMLLTECIANLPVEELNIII
ncbi:unnamed protein product [Blepharisma stoltei]|uniref:Uncharacterized protein n=1 Tax=Blepharisma stoltei TaxID=1481888 RepID=A0AAU9IUM4_9CILI|nr:unnamed protein product [Blepharisma stoltei]